MRFKKMLKNSAKLANEEWMHELPKTPEKHTFSERFEWKIRKIQEQYFIPSHPILCQVPKYAASCLLLGILSSSLLLATNVNARNSLTEWFEEHILHVTYEGDGSISGLHFEPKWLPEGYQFEEMLELESLTFWDYRNMKGEIITFYYTKGTTLASLEMEPDTSFLRVNIQNNPGYVQIYADNPKNNNITWFDIKNNIVFSILGNLDETELIHMANSVTQQH